MADSVFENITKNIVSTLSGFTLTYNGSSHVLSCDRERFVDVIGARSPLALVIGPEVSVVSRAHLRAHCELKYQIMIFENSIDDEYDENDSIAATAITETTGNIASDVVKQLMVDRTRGGSANNTEFDGCGYYIDTEGDVPLFVNYIIFTVKTFIVDTDPYQTGG